MQEPVIKIQIESIRHQDADSGFCVVKGRDCTNNKLYTLSGPMPPVREGELFEVSGAWHTHPVYGPQFKINSAKHYRPATRAAIQKFLVGVLFKNIRGLGEKAAQRVVANFGLETLEVIEKNPLKLLEVKGISKKYINEIEDAWAEHYVHASSAVFLTELGLTPFHARKVIAKYGRSVERIVSEDPYRLGMEISGIGFKICDSIAANLGIEKNSTQRIRGATFYLLQQAEDQGHCFLPNALLCERLISLLDITPEDLGEKLHQIIQNLNNEHFIVTDQSEIDGELKSDHYSYSLYSAEQRVAQRIKEILDSEFANFDPNTKSMVKRIELWVKSYLEKGGLLSQEQQKAVEQAVCSKVFILTGGPGVGKTTTANTIIGLLKAMGRSISIAAPTGRAAQRVSELSGETATTIHRLLEWNPAEGGFKKNQEQPLDCDVLIIDESSMLDIRLADSLLQAVKDSAQMIFIGDVDQLPSVGPGNVLHDLIKSKKVPYKKLEQIFRQAESSKIVRNAHQINKGEMPQFETGPSSDCQFLNAKDSEEAISKLKNLIQFQLKEAGYDPLHDIQILSPMNKGDLGAINLNEIIQGILQQNSGKPNHNQNQNSKKNFKNPFEVNDKVIQTSNNYDLGVFNGDIGFVEYKNTSEGALTVRFADEKMVHYSKEQVQELKLAYCITIHKSQGSEFPVVIIPISMSHYVMLQRNLIYTALTRGKALAIFLGSPKALHQAIQNTKSGERLTKLSQLISEGTHKKVQTYAN